MTRLIKTLISLRDEHAHTRNAFNTYTCGSGKLVHDDEQRKVDALNEAILLIEGMTRLEAAE